MDYHVNKSIIVICILFSMSCNVPYASFKMDDKAIFVCGQNSESIVTNVPCNKESADHLVLTDNGVTGGMSLFVDFCNSSYSVIAFGYFEKVGEPDFEFSIRPWNQYISEKDSLMPIYENSDCKFAYSE